MRAFSHLSIRSKLTLVITATSSMSLVLASVLFVAYDRHAFRRAKVRDLTTLASILGSNSTAALTWNDSHSAKEILAALAAKKHITAACIYTRDGRVFAKYVRGQPNGGFSPPAAEDDGSRFGNNELRLFQTILLEHEKIGTIYLQADLEELRELLNRYLVVLLPAAVGSLLVAFLLSSPLQRAISDPIRDLAWTTKMVSVEKNYSIRAVKRSNDELGLLIDGFNEMLAQIQRRDTALRAAQSQLEKHVEERTQELQQEVAERRRAEDRVRLLAQVFESTSELVAVVDLEDRITLVNRAFLKAHGYSEAEILGKPFHILLSPDNPPTLYQEILARSVQGGWQGELMLRRKDGPDFPAFLSTGAIAEEGGRPVGVFGIAKDITERKRVESELQERTAYLNGLIQNSPLAIVADDSQGVVQMCNPAFERMFLYRREEVVGARVDDLIKTEELASEAESITGRVLAGESVHLTTRRRRRDGTLVDVDLHAVPLIIEGKLIGAYGLYQDITERKRAEEELRTAKEAAEAASRAKSEFLANMSHEIRTPMNGIFGMTELALDAELDPQQREYLTMVKTSSDHLLQVINDILDFSKVEAGKLELDPVEFDLRDSLGATLKALALRAHRKGLELSHQVQPGVPRHVVGDPGRLRQILMNLVGNAIKFTEHGDVVVQVALEPPSGSPALLHFTVSDTGIGISAEKLKQIFEPFAQADGSMTRRYGGTGLGLTISARLVELMGGRLWVESEPGRGSRFHFTASFGLGKASHPQAAPRDVRNLEKLPVLVVDDSETNRRILVEVLANWQMSPAEADGGPSALAALRQARGAGRSFPLILLDAQMPDMDGFAVAEQIQRDPALSGATIMMLTSNRQPGDTARCRKLGIVVTLTKPFTQSELFDAIVTALAPPVSLPAAGANLSSLPRKRAARPLRILLAEDNAVNRMFALRLLAKGGHKVVAVRNGREALEALEESGFRGFDLVLMDVQMPEMDGLEATAAIRQRERVHGTRLPIIATTAHAMTGDRERCLEAGMDGYVSKPIRVADLLREIERRAPRAAEKTAEERAPALASPSEQALDADALLNRVEGDTGLLADLADLFLQDYPQLLAAIRDALSRRDARALEQAAHKLCGSAGNFGTAAAAAARRLEQMARQGDLREAEEACADLERELERLKPLLSKLCQEVGG